jgi:hypothetical protein
MQLTIHGFQDYQCIVSLRVAHYDMTSMHWNKTIIIEADSWDQICWSDFQAMLRKNIYVIRFKQSFHR